jgi:delta(3,5)-delta(2,4)-dienoyl-CoA isomerase
MISQTLSDHVLHVQLNRPTKLNAFNNDMWADIKTTFEQAALNRNVRAIVLSANGRVFTAGIDLASLSFPDTSDDPARKAYYMYNWITYLQSCLTSVERCPQPVIVALHGLCMGAGVDLITACDVRLCSSDTKFTVKEVDLGLAADVGTLQRLPKVVGSSSWARDVCLTGRFFGAEEAYRVGLVSQIYPDKESVVSAALDMARIIASKSPVAIAGTKHILNHARDHSVTEGLDYVAVWNAGMLNTEDIAIAVQANMNKTKPVFSKL